MNIATYWMMIFDRYGDFINSAVLEIDRINVQIDRRWCDSFALLESNKALVSKTLCKMVPDVHERCYMEDASWIFAVAYARLDLAAVWGWSKAEELVGMRRLLIAVAALDVDLFTKRIPALIERRRVISQCEEFLLNRSASARCAMRRAALSDSRLSDWLARVAEGAQYFKLPFLLHEALVAQYEPPAIG